MHSQEIQKRCEAIVKMVEKEIGELRQLEEQEDRKEEARLLAATRNEQLQQHRAT